MEIQNISTIWAFACCACPDKPYFCTTRGTAPALVLSQLYLSPGTRSTPWIFPSPEPGRRSHLHTAHRELRLQGQPQQAPKASCTTECTEGGPGPISLSLEKHFKDLHILGPRGPIRILEPHPTGTAFPHPGVKEVSPHSTVLA